MNIMFGSDAHTSLLSFYYSETINLLNEWLRTNCDNNENTEIEGNYGSIIFSEIDREIERQQARENTATSVNRMVARSMWRNDRLDLNIGNRVLKKTNFDNNRITRQRAFMDNVDFSVYILVEVVQHNIVNIKNEITDEIQVNIHTSQLRKLNN